MSVLGLITRGIIDDIWIFSGDIMNAPSVDIAGLLDASDLGLSLGTNLFVGLEPSSPDSCVTVFDTSGQAPSHTQDRGEDYYRPSVQIRVRDNDYRDAYEMIKGILDFLQCTNNFTAGGTFYSLIECSQEPSLLGWDDNRRCWWIVNFNIQRR